MEKPKAEVRQGSILSVNIYLENKECISITINTGIEKSIYGNDLSVSCSSPNMTSLEMVKQDRKMDK